MKRLRFLPLALALALGGCAATRVSDVATDPVPGNALARPAVIYVENFAVDPGAIKQSSGMLGQMQEESQQRPGLLRGLLGDAREAVGTPAGTGPLGGPPTAQAAIEMLADSITSSLNDKGLGVPAQHLEPGYGVPASGWLVRGRIVNVDPGNAARSATVGFGSGESHVAVLVDLAELRDGTPASLLSFDGGAQSRKTPGGLVAMNPYAMAAKFVVSRNATEREIKQVGEQIATEIAKFMTNRGLVPATS